MSEKSETLLNLVNKSGFVFQLCIEHEIENTKDTHKKEVLAREYRWIDPNSDQERFIDIILSTGTNGRMIIECKRVRQGNWVFLVPESDKPKNSANILWTGNNKSGKQLASWHKFDLIPQSIESSFCIIRGQGEKDQPMLERLASFLLRSTEVLALEEMETSQESRNFNLKFYFPVIITNASLSICRYDPSNIDINSGDLSGADFEEVPFIRFTKSMSTIIESSGEVKSIQDISTENQRTIFIINVGSLGSTLLEKWEIITQGFPTQMPWAM